MPQQQNGRSERAAPPDARDALIDHAHMLSVMGPVILVYMRFLGRLSEVDVHIHGTVSAVGC